MISGLEGRKYSIILVSYLILRKSVKSEALRSHYRRSNVGSYGMLHGLGILCHSSWTREWQLGMNVSRLNVAIATLKFFPVF